MATASNEADQLARFLGALLTVATAEVDGAKACTACRGWSAYHRYRRPCPCACHLARAFLVSHPELGTAAAAGAEKQGSTMQLEYAFRQSEPQDRDRRAEDED